MDEGGSCIVVKITFALILIIEKKFTGAHNKDIPQQCFFYWRSIARWRIFFSKMLILAIF
jgi:hypothetical protein